MNSVLTIQLNTTAEQIARLQALQTSFAEVCNALAPVVRQTRCWNRVALHHMTYRALREQFPTMGSQMVCNAIYSVSRMCRIVLQHPNSPWNIAKLGERPIPLLRFMPNSPVYFDRHTLSLKNGRLSMYTLDGRMHFDLNLGAADEARFHNDKLREIVLGRTPQGFALTFHFSNEPDAEPAAATFPANSAAELPEYLLVTEPGDASLGPVLDSNVPQAPTALVAAHP